MPLAQILASFNASVAQCDSLIANAHRTDGAGASLFPIIDQEQITVAAFLNMFIAWESFLEESLTELMIGNPTISGKIPTRYVTPPSVAAARDLVVWMGKYFDYANHQNLIKAVGMYFQQGYPFQPHINAIFSDLDDIRTLRNASAHISSTTQKAVESLALRVFSSPRPGIRLYQFLTAVDPRSTAGDTVYSSYKSKLVATAHLISHG